MNMRMNLESEEGEGQNNASSDADRNQDSVHVIHHAHLECHGMVKCKIFHFNCFLFLTIPRLTASTRVKAPRRMKLMGNFLLSR